jgi:hypothetical protein
MGANKGREILPGILMDPSPPTSRSGANLEKEAFEVEDKQ